VLPVSTAADLGQLCLPKNSVLQESPLARSDIIGLPHHTQPPDEQVGNESCSHAATMWAVCAIRMCGCPAFARSPFSAAALTAVSRSYAARRS
jgi:hypothetical protein